MDQQAPDLPRSVQIMGRYRTLIGFSAALGLLVGIVFAALMPPAQTSTERVVFAAPSCPGGAGAICGGPAFSPTYIRATVLEVFPSEVKITPGTGNAVSVTVVAGTAAQAAATAQAVVRTYITDAGSLNYMGEQPSAQVLGPATTPTATAPSRWLEDGALLGVVFGALLGIIMALAGARTTIDPLPVPRGLAVGDGEGPPPWRFGPEWTQTQTDIYPAANLPGQIMRE
jgi:hypothetical protein